MSRAMLSPPRMQDGKALALLKRLLPTDLGLDYEPLTFDVRDEATAGRLRLSGWWIPSGTSARTVVLLHGYADAKVGAIAWAPTLVGLGWNVLALDMRAHGQSEGKFFTAGFYERHDVSQAIDELRLLKPNATGVMVLMGISAGAVVASAVGAMHAVERRSDLAGVVLDSPFADYVEASRAHAEIVGLPPALVRPALWLAARSTGADFLAVRPLDTVARVTAPLLIIHCRSDPFISPERQRAFDASAGRSSTCVESWHVDAEHCRALATYPNDYANKLRSFLSGVVSRTG